MRVIEAIEHMISTPPPERPEEVFGYTFVERQEFFVSAIVPRSEWDEAITDHRG